MSGSGVEFRQYYRAVLKRLWLVLLLAVVLAAGVYWRTTSQPEKYAATSRIMLTTSNLLTAPTTSTDLSAARGDNNVMATAIVVIKSRPLAERVARELGIKNLSAVGGTLTASKVGGTNMMDITATTTNREMASKVANTAARQFVLLFREANRRDYRDIRLFVGSQLAQARTALELSDLQIQRAKERYAFVDLQAAMGQASSDVASTRRDIETTILRVREDEARTAAAAARLSQEKITRVYSTEFEDNPVFSQLQTRLTALEVERAEISQRYTAKHPRMIQVEGSIASIKQAMAAQSRTIVGREVQATNPIYDQMFTQIAALQVDRAAALSRLAALKASLRSRMSAVSAMPAIERRMNAFVRENEILQGNYALFSQRYQEALLRENEAGSVPSGVQVFDPAVVPKAPVGSGAQLPLRTGAGALFGLLLGVAAAIVLESSNDKIRSAQDAERTLGAPVLAHVPDMAPRTAPGGTVFLIALLLTAMLGGTLAVTRVTTEATAGSGTAMSMLVHLGRSLDGLSARVSQVIR